MQQQYNVIFKVNPARSFFFYKYSSKRCEIADSGGVRVLKKKKKKIKLINRENVFLYHQMK